MTEQKTIKLERMVLTYTHVSPFRLQRVAAAERERYIKEELDGVEPEPPTYTIQCGGGVLPNGQKLDTWDETIEYTEEYVDELREERDKLSGDSPAMFARLVELNSAIDAWDVYYETVEGIGRAVREKRLTVGLWHTFKSNMPEDDEWVKEQAEDGIDVSQIPDDERGRFLYWLETEAVATQHEFNELLLIVRGQDGAVQEARRVTRAMFQHQVEK